MISEGIIAIFERILNGLPVITMPDGFSAALVFLRNVVGYINLFLPINRLLPIIVLLIAVRNFNLVMAVVNWVIRLIPFIG
ncbi:MAG: hypothetical protein NC489_24940 [Ruminococcus flavefaciens]|nr:hypothetical protein [Ruminococcus flavefaciens]